MAKISFLWNWNDAERYFPFWKDGLWAAMQIVGQKHDVEWVFGETTLPSQDTDFILVWSSSHNESLSRLWDYKQPKGLFLTASPVNEENLKKFNVVFAESPYIVNELKHLSNVILAFGTNTKLFKPMNLPKYYDAFYPATFSPWKCQELFAQQFGSRGLVLGTIQPDGMEQYKACIDAGCWTIVGYLPAELVAQFYNMSKNCLIPAIHGSERTVLEARSCGINVYVFYGNEKAKSLLNVPLENYSEEVYAERILDAIEKT